jgi:hypothetical protein
MLLFEFLAVQSTFLLSALLWQKCANQCNQPAENISCLHYLVAYATNFSAINFKSAIKCNQ